MKRTIAIIAALFALALATAAGAAEGDKPAAKPQAQEAKAPASQQNRMKSCNEQAAKKSLKGDARKSFMSACLKGG
jgi:type II secretory pathway component PulK